LKNLRCLLAVMLLSATSLAFGAQPSTAAAAKSSEKNAAAGLTSAQTSRLAALRAEHRRAKAALPQEQQLQLDQLAHMVKGRLFAKPLDGDVLASTTQLVSEIVPGLSDVEAEGIAHYVLGAIASGPVQNAETQMSFNLQYLQLLSQMQAANRDYEAISAVLKTKHDTVKNSIGNVR
jgi:hypothetical protein